MKFMRKIDKKAKIVSEKKKKIRSKKIKKTFSSIRNFFTNNYKLIKSKYNSMNKTTKQIMFVWAGVILIVLLMAAFVSISKASLKKYSSMEKAMDVAALNYVNSIELYGTKDEKIKLPLQSLLLSNDLAQEDVAHKSCDGFSIIYFDDELEKYIVESFISCDRYTSDFYNDY